MASLNNVLFLFNGGKLDLNLTFEKITKENKIIILAVDNNSNESKKADIMTDDCEKKGKEILKKHLDGRSYNESKVDEWINNILEEFINYFKQKYPSYHLFLFCQACSKKNCTFYFSKLELRAPLNENSWSSDFETDEIYSNLFFFFFENFTSNAYLSFEPKLISFGNKLLYKIFDGKHFDRNMKDNCSKYNNELIDYILKLGKVKRCFSLTLAFKKPLKDFTYNYTMTCPYQLSKKIPTFSTSDTEIIEYLFIFSNNKNDL